MQRIQTRYNTEVSNTNFFNECKSRNKHPNHIRKQRKRQARKSVAMHELIHKVEEVARVVYTAKCSRGRKQTFSSREERKRIMACNLKFFKSSPSAAFMQLSHRFRDVKSHKRLPIPLFANALIKSSTFLEILHYWLQVFLPLSYSDL